MATEFQEQARRLRNAVEPVAAGVYFAPRPTRPMKPWGSRAARSPRTAWPARS